jgi:TPR repeat protein
MCLAVLASACRRPAPEDPWAWEKDPGLDPHPAGQTLEGPSGPKLPDVSFRIDPARGTTETTAAAQPASEEEALYLRAARSGQAWAQTKIGIKYVQEGDDIARLGEGLRWLNAAADQNDTEALRALSALAAQGRGMDQSDKESFVYMRRAAELGSPEAQYELANMLANGRGMPRDMEAAIIWGRKAANQGYAPAQFSIGRMLIESVDLDRKNEAIELLRRATAGGNSVAAIFLATVKARGDFGVAKDELEAEAILMPFAKKGDAECQFALANLYAMGQAFENNRERSREWLLRAAESGHEKARALSGTNPEQKAQ